METPVKAIYIVDDNKIIGSSLSNYLNHRFGPGIKISSFNDVESCVPKIDRQSYVIILDYSLNGEHNGAPRRVGFLNSIRDASPETDVIMISSNKAIPMATEEIRRGTSHYIISRERHFRKIRLQLEQNIFRPIKNSVPDYTKRDFLLISFSLFFIVVLYLLRF